MDICKLSFKEFVRKQNNFSCKKTKEEI